VPGEARYPGGTKPRGSIPAQTQDAETALDPGAGRRGVQGPELARAARRRLPGPPARAVAARLRGVRPAVQREFVPRVGRAAQLRAESGRVGQARPAPRAGDDQQHGPDAQPVEVGEPAAGLGGGAGRDVVDRDDQRRLGGGGSAHTRSVTGRDDSLMTSRRAAGKRHAANAGANERAVTAMAESVIYVSLPPSASCPRLVTCES